MAKLNREAAVRDRRRRKQARKDARKQASNDGLDPAGETFGDDDGVQALPPPPGDADSSGETALVTPRRGAVENEN